MSIVAPVLDKSDPKVAKLYPFHLPFSPEWSEVSDPFGTYAMTAAGGGMFIKNPLIVWGAAFMAMMSVVNQQPLRQGKEAASPLSSLGMALAGILATTFPKMMLAVAPAASAATP